MERVELVQVWENGKITYVPKDRITHVAVKNSEGKYVLVNKADVKAIELDRVKNSEGEYVLVRRRST